MFRTRRDVISTTTKPLRELVQELSPDEHAEVRDFIDFLLAKRSRGEKRALRQDWAGSLRDYRDKHTSLEPEWQALAW